MEYILLLLQIVTSATAFRKINMCIDWKPQKIILSKGSYSIDAQVIIHCGSNLRLVKYKLTETNAKKEIFNIYPRNYIYSGYNISCEFKKDLTEIKNVSPNFLLTNRRYKLFRASRKLFIIPSESFHYIIQAICGDEQFFVILQIFKWTWILQKKIKKISNNTFLCHYENGSPRKDKKIINLHWFCKIDNFTMKVGDTSSMKVLRKAAMFLNMTQQNGVMTVHFNLIFNIACYCGEIFQNYTPKYSKYLIVTPTDL